MSELAWFLLGAGYGVAVFALGLLYAVGVLNPNGEF